MLWYGSLCKNTKNEYNLLSKTRLLRSIVLNIFIPL